MTTNSNLSDSDGSGGESGGRDETFMPPRGHLSEDGSSCSSRSNVRNDENQIVPHHATGSRQAGRDSSSKMSAAAVVIQRGNGSAIVGGIGTQQHEQRQELWSQKSALSGDAGAAAAGAAAPPPPRPKRRRRKIQSNPQQQPQQEQHNHQHQDGHPRPKKKKQTSMSSSSSLSFTSGSFLASADDDEFAFHEDTNTTTTTAATISLHRRRKRNHSEPQFRSLPILIEERRLGGHIGRSTIGKNKNATMMTTAKRISRLFSSTPKQFQFEALKTFTSVPSKPTLARRQWRPYVVYTNFSTSRSSSRRNNNNNSNAFSSSKIPFTQLGTPPEDAVLALHRDGNYALSIGPYDMTATTSHGLAVRFHSLPTPHQRLMKHMSSMTNKKKSNRQMNQSGQQQQQLQQQQQQQHQVQQEHPSIFGVSDIQVHHTIEDAPLLQTIPLLEGIGSLRDDQVMAGDSDAAGNGAGAGTGTGAGVGVDFADFGAEAESAIFNFQRAVSPANTPVEFLISHDWSIGICRLRPSSTSQWQDVHGVTSRRGDSNDNGSSNNETSHVEHDQQLRHREDGDVEREENDPYQPELAPVGSLVLFTLPHGRRNLQKPRTGSVTDDCGKTHHKKQEKNDVEKEEESTTESLESTAPSEETISNTNQIYYRCQNVQIVSNAGMTTRNLLWNVDAIPTQVSQSVSYDTASASFASYVEAPGYLFLNDEADGFRLTWIATSNRSYLDKAKRHSIKEEGVGETPNSDTSCTHIVTIESSWEEHSVTSMSGQPIYRSSNCATPTHNTPEFCASIVSEAYLHIDRVLALVLQSRKGMIRPPGQSHRPVLPEFCYNLISTENNGRTAQLLIAFLRPKGGYALGIFVEVDLFSGTYTEKNWVQDRLVQDAASMHFWCTKLTLNRRMKAVRAGPYALSARESNYKDWTRLCHEIGNINPDHDDDFDQNFWDGQEASSRVISLASLYPCCDVVTNQALIDCCPVPSIRAKHSPIQLVYG